jgi:hypothetical protein
MNMLLYFIYLTSLKAKATLSINENGLSISLVQPVQPGEKSNRRPEIDMQLSQSDPAAELRLVCSYHHSHLQTTQVLLDKMHMDLERENMVHSILTELITL